MNMTTSVDSVEKRFLVNLSGIIDILSKHLYSGPHVFIRELLQNSTDAISARYNYGESQNNLEGKISITLLPKTLTHSQPQLVIEDNGSGLTEAEIHQFLAVIGESSKKELLNKKAHDYIGQFGIGLLACFMVSNNICLQTRSIKQKDRVFQWQGNPDGTYQLDEIEQQMEIGTRVILTAKTEGEDYFTDASLRHWMQYYASYLPYEITLNTTLQSNVRINPLEPPWHWGSLSKNEFVDRAILIGEKYFRGPFFDTLALKTKAGKVRGLGYIISHATTEHQQKHMIHLKGMRLTKSAQNILPDWAFFVRTIINADDLRPTASREALYEDATLLEAKEELGEQLISYLVNIAENEPNKFQHFVSCHQMALKSLVLDNHYFCLKISPFLKFETNLGSMTLGQYIEKYKNITYVESVDSFRQFAQISGAKQECLINAGYSYCTEILNLYAHLSKIKIEILDPQSLVGQLEETEIDPYQLADFINKAKTAMSEICPNISVKKFQPEQVPSLYISCEKQYFVKSAKINQVESDELWSDIIDTVTKPIESYMFSELCLNANHELITSLIHCKDLSKLQQCLKIIYVQSLLMGHFPLNENEMDILNSGLISMMTTSLTFQDNSYTQH
ncbi:HSP90 family protein [Pseudoalteromonas sp. S558]|uniref:HSP90 family protein n=1 Tax=Pseudoalteromonas sp. S558 TaxID=2066515 RepID=UPI00110BB110|nr:HSP90 family protein [Pseudoalteromonas sp. S558]TMO09558.1 HSP90 family protein [Pseudoalteromonas sp. S558]